jgi:hypothetical protein
MIEKIKLVPQFNGHSLNEQELGLQDLPGQSL